MYISKHMLNLQVGLGSNTLCTCTKAREQQQKDNVHVQIHMSQVILNIIKTNFLDIVVSIIEIQKTSNFLAFFILTFLTTTAVTKECACQI